MDFFHILDTLGYAGLKQRLAELNMKLISHGWVDGEERLVVEEGAGKYVLYRR